LTSVWIQFSEALVAWRCSTSSGRDASSSDKSESYVVRPIVDQTIIVEGAEKNRRKNSAAIRRKRKRRS
jgi:hypothetical protein